MSLSQITARYLSSVLSSMDVDPVKATQPHTDVRPEIDRTESGMAVAYHVGQPTVIRTDPALVDPLADLVDPQHAVTSSEFRHWATARGWRFIDGGDHHLIDQATLKTTSLPSTARLVQLDGGDDTDRARIAPFLARNDPDDVDEAEFAMDDLDPFILGLVDGDDELRALVSGRVWEVDEAFDDIGVLVDGDLRGAGWGSAAVGAFCAASFDRGRIPFYRCSWSRTASKALAAGLGFSLVGQVTAVGP